MRTYSRRRRLLKHRHQLAASRVFVYNCLILPAIIFAPNLFISSDDDGLLSLAPLLSKLIL